MRRGPAILCTHVLKIWTVSDVMITPEEQINPHIFLVLCEIQLQY